ncbi:MAG: hypothetical protein L6R41_000531 [Letrouitia leprolyta]|nr:MAG: hypothetical protein L6R41_000531 [Letrouitia leprolyta]
MPGIGDQHKATNAGENPYEEVKSHVSEYTAQEIATLSSRLEKQLGPEFISTRQGPSGQRVPYLAADKCINLANEVFGFNGWSSAIQQIQIDFVDESQSNGKVSLGLSVIVRVSLRDGTYHEDIGYGHIENCKGKAAAFEKAKKEGTTDGLKRALRNFGNILGNCVYDKDYISKVMKIKVAPSRWDPDNLHRHPDFAPMKKEPTSAQDRDFALIKTERNAGSESTESKASGKYNLGEPEDEFATDDFDEVDFSASHEVNLDELSSDHSAHINGRENAPSRANATNSRTAHGGQSEQTYPESNVHPHLNGNSLSNGVDRRPPNPLQGPTPQQSVPRNAPRPPGQPNIFLTSVPVGNQPRPQVPPQKEVAQVQEPQVQGTPPSAASTTFPHNPPVGFYTARVAETVQNAAGVPMQVPSFNPHLESPSIRKTAGIDHSKTKPVGKDIVGAPPSPAVMSPASRPNFVNPQADKTRRVGMPVGAASPLSNRSLHKPLQIKRVVEGNSLQ